jgi:FAD/FMN-containing dehydrogenase
MSISRRRFLRTLGTGVAAASVGCAGSPGSSAPTSTPPAGNPPPTGGPPPPTGGNPPGGNPPPASCPPATLTGRIVRPGDPDYDAARGNYNGRISIGPRLIVFASNIDDVTNAVCWARGNQVALRARSGRHSYEGYSLVDDGLVLDVSGFNGVGYDPVSGVARLGAGSTVQNVYQGLAASGVMIPLGSCNSLGLAGLTLGGGVGLSGRQYGLTCDAVRAIDLVTADGQVARATAALNPDLFWALRGGGGGNLGVVTAFEFTAQPAADVSTYSMTWPLADFAAVMSVWQGWAPYTDPRLFTIVSVTGKQVFSVGQLNGDTSELQNLLAPLLAVGSPANVQLQGLSFVAAAASFGDDDAAARPKFKNSSAYVTAPLSDAALAAIVAQVTSGPGPSNTIQFDSFGGAISSVAADATAFVHRQALCDVQIEAFWQNDSDEAGNRAWVQQTRQALAPYTTGAYVNYIDADISDFADAYYGSNLARLSQIKRTWDPTGFFGFPQAIPG